MKTIDIAENEGLNIIETTTGTNGYPKHLKFAIVGFDTFKQAQELADKYDLNIENFKIRDGHQLWQRNGNTMYDAMSISAEDYGDNYSEESFDTVCDLINDTQGSSFDSTEDYIDFLKSQIELLEEIEKAEDDEIVLTQHGEYYDTVKQKTMCWNNGDVHTYQIGLIKND